MSQTSRQPPRTSGLDTYKTTYLEPPITVIQHPCRTTSGTQILVELSRTTLEPLQNYLASYTSWLEKVRRCRGLEVEDLTLPPLLRLSVRHHGREPDLQGPGSDDPRPGGDDW